MKKESLIIGLMVFSLFFIFSCSKRLFPLCPKLSNTKPSEKIGVGKTIFDVCNERKIKITILSTNIAEFSGSTKDIKWLQENYHILICDFDQEKSLLGRTEYTNCLAKSEEWIKLIQNKKIDELMLDGTLYCPTCVPNQFCN
jgi:hypothetical protein